MTVIILVKCIGNHEKHLLQADLLLSMCLLADPKNVLLTPLHIKLELMKCFVRAMDHQGSGFKYLKEKFGSYKTEAKLTAGIFISPEIRKIFC